MVLTNADTCTLHRLQALKNPKSISEILDAYLKRCEKSKTLFRTRKLLGKEKKKLKKMIFLFLISPWKI